MTQEHDDDVKNVKPYVFQTSRSYLRSPLDFAVTKRKTNTCSDRIFAVVTQLRSPLSFLDKTNDCLQTLQRNACLLKRNTGHIRGRRTSASNRCCTGKARHYMGHMKSRRKFPSNICRKHTGPTALHHPVQNLTGCTKGRRVLHSGCCKGKATHYMGHMKCRRKMPSNIYRKYA